MLFLKPINRNLRVMCFINISTLGYRQCHCTGGGPGDCDGDLQYVTRLEGAEMEDSLGDVGVVLEGHKVLQNLCSVPCAAAMLMGQIYGLNLSYPPELRYTFEALQKLILELDGNNLSNKKCKH